MYNSVVPDCELNINLKWCIAHCVIKRSNSWITWEICNAHVNKAVVVGMQDCKMPFSDRELEHQG